MLIRASVSDLLLPDQWTNTGLTLTYTAPDGDIREKLSTYYFKLGLYVSQKQETNVRYMKEEPVSAEQAIVRNTTRFSAGCVLCVLHNKHCHGYKRCNPNGVS